MRFVTCLAAACLLAMSSFAPAEHRVALLIGNSAYPDAPLAAPVKNVRALAPVLEKRGFHVTVHENVTSAQLKSVVEDFADTVPVRATALVYLSGYALPGGRGQYKHDNYLLPVDGKAKNEWEVSHVPYGVHSIAKYLLEESGSAANIVVLEGSHQHPQQEDQRKDKDKDKPLGLRKFGPPPPESVIVYATEPGKVVEPTEGLSPLAASLVKSLKDPGASLAVSLQSDAGYFASSIKDLGFLDEKASQAVASPEHLPTRAQPGQEWVGPYGMVFCWCPPGKFTMGSPPDLPYRHDDEGPVEVTISRGFWVSKYEWTLHQYKVINGRTPYQSLGDYKNQPANKMRLDNTRKLLVEMTKKQRAAGVLPGDWEYAMPTEAQWEYAARAGTQTPFYFGSDISLLPRHANFADRTLYRSPEGLYVYAHQTLDDGFERMAPVGSFRPNPWGLHDVYGNVWEWCDTNYEADLTGGTDPNTPPKSGRRERQVARGGSWQSRADYCRSAFRNRFEPRDKTIIGMRLILQPK